MSLFRYSAAFINWKKEKMSKFDRRARKLLTMHKAHHPKDDVHRLYIKRKEGDRGLISREECVEDAIVDLHYYILYPEQSGKAHLYSMEIISETRNNRALKDN